MKKDVFTNQVTIITGASSGIGRELAVQMAALGARLVLAARDRARLEETAERCRQAGATVLVVPTDITQADQCQALVLQTIQKFGRLDILINNAGTSIEGDFADYTDLGALEQLTRINYLGSAYCTYYALPHLKQSRGRLVAISSLAGLNGIPGLSGYVASKHAQTGFFNALRLEPKKDGVSVTVVYPGSVASHPEDIRPAADEKTAQPALPPGMMALDTCARITLAAIADRRRDLVMPPGQIARWMNLLAPAFLDRMILNGIEKDRAKRKENFN